VTRMYLPQRMSIGFTIIMAMSQIEAHFFTRLALTTMKLLPNVRYYYGKVIAGIHDDKFHIDIYWTEEYIGIKDLLLNMKQLPGPVVSELDEQETYLHKSTNSTFL
jgi:hypothetical protein